MRYHKKSAVGVMFLDNQDLLQEENQPIHQHLQTIDQRFDQIDGRLDKIEERLEHLEEDAKITRTSVNLLLDWAENVSITVKVPLLKKAE